MFAGITHLEHVQRRAARYVTNRYHMTPLALVTYDRSGHLILRSLADRRTDTHIVMLYKILHEFVIYPLNRHTHTIG